MEEVHREGGVGVGRVGKRGAEWEELRERVKEENGFERERRVACEALGRRGEREGGGGCLWDGWEMLGGYGNGEEQSGW